MQSTTYFLFGPFAVNPESGELWRHGSAVRLHRQAGLLLGLLARRAPELVTYDEIRHHLWGDRHVEYDQGIHACIRKVRTALNDSAAQPVWIHTVPRAGYRIMRDVRPVSKLPTRSTAQTGLRRLAVALSMTLLFVVDSRGYNSSDTAVLIVPARHATLASDVSNEIQLMQPAPHLRIQRARTGNAALLIPGQQRRTHPVLTDSESAAASIARWAVATLSKETDQADHSPELVRDAFLKGEYLLESGNAQQIRASRKLFDSVLTLAPDFAPAYAAKGMSYLMTGDHFLAEENVNRALALDPTNRLARLTRADIELWIYWNREVAQNLHTQILAEHPGWAPARVSHAFLLSTRGEHAEAIAQARLALALDPVSPTVHGDLGLIYLMARQYDLAAAECQKTLDLAADVWVARDCRVSALVAAGDTSKALAEIPLIMSALGGSQRRGRQAGDSTEALTAYWEWMLEWSSAPNSRWFPYIAARAHTNLGAIDAAIRVLTEAIDEHKTALRERPAGQPRMAGTAMLVALDVDPRLDPLRQDPRFEELLRQVHTSEGCCQ